MTYKSFISPKMQAVSEDLMAAFEGMSHCMTETHKNLIVEVPKTRCEAVRAFLKQKYQDVALIRNAYPMMEDLHDYILVKPLISESPIFQDRGVNVPELEKLLVDYDSDKEYSRFSNAEKQKEFQRAFELYHVNTSRLLRYAGRKGKKEEIRTRIDNVDQDRVKTIHTIQEFLQHQPVERAWLFGSYSRMEERPDSDIDLLIDLDPSVPMGLLQYAGMMNQLGGQIGRKVDLVAEGSVKPFAKDSINHDRILVYERS